MARTKTNPTARETVEVEETKTEEIKTVEETVEIETVLVYKVCKGKSITTKVGIKADGDEVEEKHFVTKKVFDNLVTKKFIEKV